MAKLELFGASSCPYTREMREWLEGRGREFVEYDVDVERSARERMRSLPGAPRMVPMLLEDGNVVQIGWRGRGCMVE